MRAWFAALAVSVIGCGPGGGFGDDDPEVDASIDTPGGDGFTTLIEREWTVLPRSEAFVCTRVKIEQDMFISAFQAMSPTGTHHEFLTISSTNSPLGDYDCPGSNLEPQLMFAGGVNTDEFDFPPGVAIKLTAGTYINLRLHLFNADEASSLSGTSGVRVKTMPASEVVHEADMVFAGHKGFTIPASPAPYKVTGGCSLPTQWHIFGLWPHMHGYGMHQKVIVKRGGNVMMTPLDADYDFDHQKNYAMADTTLQVNDQIQVTCTFVNTTSPMTEIFEGDNYTTEMCLTGIYKYPAGGSSEACVSAQ
ncbi:MAG: hypothetical protein HOV81_23080 [Kofleriaceae bacterium]|nr:hypothetical protein [Kofleriaceae bacterium]